MSRSTEPAPPSAERRAELILDHMPRVRWIATRIHRQLMGAVALEDLMSAGVLGLIAAVDKYDPSYNVKLNTYAHHKIRGAILDSIRTLDGVPAHKKSKVRSLERAISAAEQRLGHSPVAEDIAAELGISVDEYHAWLLEVRAVTMGSLDSICGDGQGTIRLGDVIADHSTSHPYEALERAELEALIQKGLDSLPPVERTIMHLYYKEEQCLREIAAVVNLHTTRISQLKSQATLRLRNYVRCRWLVEKNGKPLNPQYRSKIRPGTLVAG